VIAVISDLHLGPKDSTDVFGHSDARFTNFLRRLERGFDRVILLGDIWETLTPEQPFDHRGALRRAREAHPEIAQRLERPVYQYLCGNHDLVSHDVLGAQTELTLELDGCRLHFTHGHQHDWLIRRARWLSEILVWGGGLTRRLGWSFPYRVGAWLDTWICRSRAGGERDSFRLWALERAAEKEADVVVTGHTHVSERVTSGSRLYLNSGSCTEGSLSFLMLDPKRGRFELCAE
jgi:predicted phosphodiesterase